MLEFQKKLSNSFYALLSLPSTALGFALSVQISALSWIMSTQYGLNLEEIGKVWSAGPIAGLFAQLIFGFISDKVWFWGGRRRPFVILGGALAGLSLLALPNIGLISDKLGIADILIVSVIIALTLDISINIGFNPTRSIISDVTPRGVARTKGYTWMQTISGTFGVLAYAIGAIFGNFVLIYFAVGLVLCFTVVPMFFITEQKDIKLEEDKQKDLDTTKSDTKDFIIILFAHAFSWVGVQTMFIFMIGYIEQYLNPVDDKETGWIIAISFLVLNAVGALVPAFLLEPLSEKIGRVKTHVFALSLMTIGYAGIIFFGYDYVTVFIFMGIAGVGWGGIVSLPFAIMSEKINQNRMGLFMGIFNLAVVLPQLFVSFYIGSVVESVSDKKIIFIISAVTVAVSTILWSFVKESKAMKIDRKAEI